MGAPSLFRERPPTLLEVDDDDNAPSTRLVYFYKPPDERTPPEELAQRVSLLIFTKKDEGYRDLMRAAGYSGPVLQYLLAAEVIGPAGALSATDTCAADISPWHNQVAYEPQDFCASIHPNEDWFLHNGRGERLYGIIGGTPFYHMNPASPGWRSFFIARARRFLAGDSAHPPLGYDGLFLDNVELSLDRALNQMSNSDGAVREFADNTSYYGAWESFLAAVSQEFRPRWPVWANMISGGSGMPRWEPYLTYLEGGMNEAFATGWAGSPPNVARWEADLSQAEDILALGKGYLAVARGDNSDDLQPFALGSYLLISNNSSVYFRYLRQPSEHRYLPSYANESMRLGSPRGARYRQQDGTWRRDFSRGYVIVDPLARTAQIVSTVD